MENYTELIGEYVNSINFELDRFTTNLETAKSDLIRIAYAFTKGNKEDKTWVFSKALMDIETLLDTNLNILIKMKRVLFRIKLTLYIQLILNIFHKSTINKTPNFKYFSWLLDKTSENIEKAIDEMMTIILPFSDKKDLEVAQTFLTLLKGPIDNITLSKQVIKNINNLLFEIQAKSNSQPLSLFSDIEKKIFECLLDTVPPAALTYKQAVIDLANRDRSSYRGVANEFRESLRETVNLLASDEAVKTQPNFKFEPGQTTPTMKQKVRYILKSRGAPDNARKTPEDALEIIEERIASFARATYDRSSISTHIATEWAEVQQIKQYTNALFSELLKIGF